MDQVAVIGGHGQIALALTRLLAADGTAVRSVVRNPDHRDDIEEAGGSMVIADLEESSVDDLAAAIAGSAAVVFAAGAGPGSGAARKHTVDHAGAVLTRDAAIAAAVPRILVVSAMGTDDPPQGDDVFEVYLRAKAEADRAVMDSPLAWTILRPGRLTDDAPTGQVTLARHVDRGEVTRADVADVTRHLLAEDRAARQILELVGGTTPVAQAVAAAVGA